MNERILNLAEQAGIAVWGDAVYMYDPKDTLDSTVMAKFAELIVQKCMSFQDEAGVYSKFDMADAIAQHFGVEK